MLTFSCLTDLLTAHLMITRLVVSQVKKSRITIPTKQKLYNTCILPIFLYGSECWAVTKRDVHWIWITIGKIVSVFEFVVSREA